MKEYQSENIRNISIMGAAQIGKTSLSEAMLFNKGITTRQGSVDEGTSILDFEADEIQRKISISSALFSIETDSNKLNFIDTPGYPGFVSQLTTAANVCESALAVVCASNGVEMLTRKAWKLSNSVGQSKFVFINRMERERVEFDKVLEDIRAKLSTHIHPIMIPIGEGESFSGVIDLIQQKAYSDTHEGLTEIPIPDNQKDQVETMRSSLMEAAAENSEDLLNQYLEEGALSEADFIKGIKLGINSNDIIPLMVGSAHKNMGINKTLDYLSLLAPNPIEKNKTYTCEKEETLTLDPNGAPLVQIFKIMDDSKLGEYFFFKVFSGAIKSSQELNNVVSKQKERIGHLFVFQGKNRIEVTQLTCGDIGATAKLKAVTIGDTLQDAKTHKVLQRFVFSTPIISEAVNTPSEKEREKMGEGLININRLDPCFKYEHRPEFGEMIISGQSNLQLEVMIQRIKTKYGITINMEKPRIPYRETIRKASKSQGKHKKQSGGHGQYGDCWIELTPQPLGAGYEFANSISGGAIPSKYIPAVDKGVREAMVRGILAGYPAVDIKATCCDGTYHNVDSSDLAFQMAGIAAFKKAAEAADPVILEPIMNITVTIPEDSVGDVSADFNQRRGKILNMEASEDAGYKIIKAQVPQSELYHYSVDLKSMTKGDAMYSESLDRYEVVPANITKKIIEETKKEAELVKA